MFSLGIRFAVARDGAFMRRSRIRGRRFGVRFSMLCCWNSERFQSEDESRGSGTRLRNTRDTIVVFVCTGNQVTPLLVCVACSDHTGSMSSIVLCSGITRAKQYALLDWQPKTLNVGRRNLVDEFTANAH